MSGDIDRPLRGSPLEAWHRGRCPVLTCRGKDIAIFGPDSAVADKVAKLWQNENRTAIAVCHTCGILWEPWPAGTPSDSVERKPCDNCAYRSGSLENAEADQRENLIELAQHAAAYTGVGPCAFFQCHKGMPIVIKREGEPSIRFAPELAGIKPGQQTCGGFLRVLWAQNRELAKYVKAES